MTVGTTLTVWLLDQKNAFLALTHAYLWWVLAQTGLPAFVRRALLGSHRRVVVRVQFGGRDHGEVVVDRWIKQGCPTSGTLWAIASDPVIRILDASVAGVPASLTVSADDVAIATARLVETGRRAFEAVDIVSPMVAIGLNPAKTLALACFPHDALDIPSQLAEADLRAGTVGRRKGAASWHTHPAWAVGAWAGDTWVVAARSRRIKGAGRSHQKALAMFQTCVAPVPAYRLQFRPPDERLWLTEEAALPMRAIRGLACARSELGLRSARSTMCRWRPMPRPPLRSPGHASATGRIIVAVL